MCIWAYCWQQQWKFESVKEKVWMHSQNKRTSKQRFILLTLHYLTNIVQFAEGLTWNWFTGQQCPLVVYSKRMAKNIPALPSFINSWIQGTSEKYFYSSAAEKYQKERDLWLAYKLITCLATGIRYFYVNPTNEEEAEKAKLSLIQKKKNPFQVVHSWSTPSSADINGSLPC